jgi:FecR protein
MDASNNNTENESQPNRNDYLWDGSGAPDPEIQKLQALLGEFRYNRPAPSFPAIVPSRSWTFFPWRMRLFPVLGATAAALLAITVIVFLTRGRQTQSISVAGWEVSRRAGTPQIGSTAIHANERPSRFGVGQVLETDAQSRASLQAEDVGQIEIEPNSRVRLLTMGQGLKRIALDRGKISAFIWSPPGQFVVDTPSATTVDLGCAYTLQVDDSGNGLVRTSLGWVGFKLNGHESFIPAGAACATRPKVGPGTPYFENSSAEFRAALTRFDFEDRAAEQRSADLQIILAQSRKGDTLTLWHLLTRVDEGQRGLVYDRLAQLAPPPARVEKDGILRLDQPMLDLWWNALGFEDISIWRHWERSWSGTTSGATSGTTSSGASGATATGR